MDSGQKTENNRPLPDIWKVFVRSPENHCKKDKSFFFKVKKDIKLVLFNNKIPFVSLCDKRIPVVSLCDCRRFKNCNFKYKNQTSLVSCKKSCKICFKKPEKKLTQSLMDKWVFDNSEVLVHDFKKSKFVDKKKSQPESSVSDLVFYPVQSSKSQMINLKRNSVLRTYSCVFLPFTDDLIITTKAINYYREQILKIPIEEGNWTLAHNFLMSFSTMFEWSQGALSDLLGLVLKVQADILYSSVLFLCQKQSMSIPHTQIDHALQDHQGDEFSLSLLLKCLELNLFSVNLCDANQIHHTVAYKLLSWDKGKNNLTKMLLLLGSLINEAESNNSNLSKIYAVQGFVSLGLMSSLKERFFALESVASELYTLYCSLQIRSQKRLLLQTVELPNLLVKVVHKAIIEQFTVNAPAADAPSLQGIIDHYFTPLAKEGQCKLDEDDCEEYVCLLYFLLWATMETIKQKSNMPFRSCLMKPELEDIPTVVRTPAMTNFTSYLRDMCGARLTAKTLEYLLFVNFLLDLILINP